MQISPDQIFLPNPIVVIMNLPYLLLLKMEKQKLVLNGEHQIEQLPIMETDEINQI